MKTIFRNLALGVLLSGISVVGTTTTFAQDACTDLEANQALYKKYTDNYAGKLDQVKVAIAAAKEYIQKYEGCVDATTKNPTFADQINYLKGALPEREAYVKKTEEGAAKGALLARFDTAVKGTNNVANASETYALGKDVVALNNEYLLDMLLTLGTVGFDQASATPSVDTYNNETIEYAKQAIQKLEANATSKTGNYGLYGYSYKNKEYTDGKSNALGAMNYNIGYILYYRQGKDNPEKKKEALPYFYKATQYNSFSKKNPFVYQTIGAWYLDQALKIDSDRTNILKANGNKDTEETIAMVANQKGYADRAIDAYARAYKLAKDDKTSKPDYVTGLYTKLKDLYAFRYDGKTTGIDEFVASVQSKPLPDPTAPITPVKEEAPTPAANTTSSTTPVTPDTTKPATKPVTNTTTPGTTTKPATTPVVKKPTSSTTTKSSDSTNVSETTTLKPAVKKTTPKKKGTR